MTARTTRLPSEEEVEPWYQAVCALWDDAALYHSVAARAREIAEQRYSETASRDTHVRRVVKAAFRRPSRLERVHELSVVHGNAIYTAMRAVCARARRARRRYTSRPHGQNDRPHADARGCARRGHRCSLASLARS